jgi:hypothetical protein
MSYSWLGDTQRGEQTGKALKASDIHCHFCGGELGDVETQPHSNPNFAEYRTCLSCDYQWAKEYWAWLAQSQGVVLKQ